MDRDLYTSGTASTQFPPALKVSKHNSFLAGEIVLNELNEVPHFNRSEAWKVTTVGAGLTLIEGESKTIIDSQIARV